MLREQAHRSASVRTKIALVGDITWSLERYSESLMHSSWVGVLVWSWSPVVTLSPRNSLVESLIDTPPVLLALGEYSGEIELCM